jgi:hypothetical protein
LPSVIAIAGIKASATAVEDYRLGWIKGCLDYTADHVRGSKDQRTL